MIDYLALVVAVIALMIAIKSPEGDYPEFNCPCVFCGEEYGEDE